MVESQNHPITAFCGAIADYGGKLTISSDIYHIGEAKILP
jgi:hypothetical protein